MKKLICLLVLSVIIFTGVSSQQEINADEIVQKINNNQSVSYKNVIVYGDLNFTKIENIKLHETYKKYKNYICTVKPEIYFENCVFKGNVFTCSWTKNPNNSYTVHFSDAVSFINCVFERDCNFKHAKFMSEAIYTGTDFSWETNFKFANFLDVAMFNSCVFKSCSDFNQTTFSMEVAFQKSVFEKCADFKFAHFPDHANFSNAVFNNEADFKHATFLNGVDFSDAQFLRCCDFKHAQLTEPFSIEGVVFKGDADFQHTMIDDKAFVDYLLQSRN